MATYTPTNAGTFRSKGGSLSEKLGYEFSNISAGLSAARIQTVDLTASMVSGTSLAANGVDLASGTNATFYAVFVAPAAITIVGMVTYLTEAYVKETTDAKIELKTEAASPVLKCVYTFLAAGQPVKTMNTTLPSSPSLAAGDALDMVVTQSASTSGTGHAKVFLKYTVN